MQRSERLLRGKKKGIWVLLQFGALGTRARHPTFIQRVVFSSVQEFTCQNEPLTKSTAGLTDELKGSG